MRSMMLKVFICGVFVLAAIMNTTVTGQNKFAVNDEALNKVVTSKTIYRYKAASRLHLKYDYGYNVEGRLSEKKASKWDEVAEEWTPCYITNFTYIENQLVVDHSIWNEKNEAYNNKKKNVYMLDESRAPVAYLSYKWDNNRNEWKVSDTSVFSSDKDITFVSTE